MKKLNNNKVNGGIIIILLLITGFVTYELSGSKYIFVSEEDKEMAIQQAQEYSPEGFCTMALVDAKHIDTGAKYTFSSGCLAPGWVPDN